MKKQFDYEMDEFPRSRSASYQRRCLLRSSTYNARVGGSTLQQFTEAMLKSLSVKLGAKMTRTVAKAATKLVNEVWLQRNCGTCIDAKRLIRPPKSCPECQGRGYTKQQADGSDISPEERARVLAVMEQLGAGHVRH